MKKILPVVVSFIITLLSVSTSSASEHYFECNSCSNIQMKLKAQSTNLVGSHATAHVFNESDMRYERYRVYREIVGTGEEAMTQISSFPLPPNTEILVQFQDYVIAKKGLEAEIGFRQFILNGDGSVTLTNNFDNLNNSSNTSSDLTLQFAFTSVTDEGGCDRRGPPRETLTEENTAHDYLRDSQLRQDLFNRINREFDTSGVGNMPEFFAKHDKFFKTLQETGLKGIEEVGGILSMIGNGSSTLSVITPDNGKMEITLNFNRSSAQVVYAKDGDCNEIPITGADLEAAEFGFTSITGQKAMEERFEILGRLVTGSNGTRAGFRCKVRKILCYTDHDGTSKPCKRKECLTWVKDF